MKSVNGTLTETLYGSVTINEDIHLDANHTHNNSPRSQNLMTQRTSNIDSMVQTAAILVAIVSAIGVIVILMQPEKKTLMEEEQLNVEPLCTVKNSIFMDKNPSENKKLKAIREQKEQPLLDAFQGAKMWFHEKVPSLRNHVKIETDAWGVRITLDSIAHPTFTISGRWDMIHFGSDYIGCSMVGWSLYSECPYPEWFERMNCLMPKCDDSKVNSLSEGCGLGTSTAISEASREERRGAAHQPTG